MPQLTGKTVAIVVADGVEQVEVTAPRDALRSAGATVRVVSPDGSDVRGYHYIDPGDTIRVDGKIAHAGDFDALLLPGGLGGPDSLRKNDAAVSLVRSAVQAEKPIGVICHGPWLLIEADALTGRTLTCAPQLSTDIANAGATYVDAEVHAEPGRPLLVSGRNHDTAEKFADSIVDELSALWR